MPILLLVKGTITRAQYEELRREVGWEAAQPEGGVVHAAAFENETTIRVTDVWESEEAMGRFMEARLMPVLQRMGIPQPEMAVYPLANLNLMGRAREHLI